MEKEFINYTEALALKELGFNEPCFFVYNRKNELVQKSPTIPLEYCINIDGGHGAQCTAPLYQQAFRWFREKYFIYPSIIQLRGWVNSYKIIKWDSSCDATTVYDSNNYQTYEEAELECLIKLIEIVKQK